MKKTFIIALIAMATILAVGCKKDGENAVVEEPNESQVLDLAGTSWTYNLESSLFGQTVKVYDTLNFLDDKSLFRNFSFVASSFDNCGVKQHGYTWDGTNLALLDSIGEPTGMTFTYRDSDNVFLRDMDSSDDMSTIFDLMGVTEMVYIQIK